MFERLQAPAAKAYAKKPRKGGAARPFFSTDKPEGPPPKKSRQADDVEVEEVPSFNATPDSGRQHFDTFSLTPYCYLSLYSFSIVFPLMLRIQNL